MSEKYILVEVKEGNVLFNDALNTFLFTVVEGKGQRYRWHSTLHQTTSYIFYQTPRHVWDV